MKNAGNKSEAAILRQKAEDLLKNKLSKAASQISETDPLKLVHELEVHQIELQMQNEELIQARSASMDAAEKYIELYDFAPSGYFTLSREGEIIELNLYGSQMLGKERSRLKNNSFGFFVSSDTRQTFNLFLEKVFNSKTKESCEITLSPYSNNAMYVHVTGIVTENGEQCLVTIFDITAQKQALELAGVANRQKNLILEAAGEGILGIDLAGHNTFVNRMAVEILGYSVEELLGKNSHELFHHHHRDGTLYPIEDCPIYNTLRSGKPSYGEEYFWRKDGTGFPAEFSSLPIMEEYKITGVVVTFRDISTHKRAEEDARKAYEVLEATLDALPDVLFDVGLDGYCYDFHSPRAELQNNPAEEIIGKTIPNIFPPLISEVIMSAIKEAHEKGISVGKQYELKGSSGISWFEISVSRKVSAPEDPPHFIILRRDITERKLAYEALRLNEAKLTKIVSNFSEVVIIIDKEGIIRYKSPNIEKWFGWRPEDVVGASFWENVHPEDTDFTQKFMETLMVEPNATGTTKFRYRCKDGGHKSVEMTVVNLLHDPDIRGFLGYYHDITKCK